MIHIVFQSSDADLLRDSMQLDEGLSGEIFEIKEEWGVGPLQQLDTEEGWHARLDWWRELLKGSPYGEEIAGSFDDRSTINGIRQALATDPADEAWIWIGPNQHDITGYYWLIAHLHDLQGRLMIIFLNNLPFINEKGQIFYPWAVHDILPREVIKAKKLARPVTLSECEVDTDEWKRISEENALVRIPEGGKKIAGREVDFYDGEILKNITGEWQKATRVMMNTMHRMKIKTGDVFLMWRMKQLITEGKIAVMGDIEKGWKDFDVKAPVSIQEEIVFENKEV